MTRGCSCPRLRIRGLMKCLCSGEMLKADDFIQSSKSIATRDLSAGGLSSHTGEGEQRVDNGNIEEAESSLREGGCLNYEEARALLGRLEYQRGNMEAALHVFDGIDFASLIPKIKMSISIRAVHQKARSKTYSASLMSMHAVSLLFEAIFLKAKSLQDLGRFKEAAISCNNILDTVESALPDGLPQNFGTDSKLQETISKAVELLPELWKMAGSFQEAILAYRRALLNCWNLDAETSTRIEKEFAVFLLYSGSEANPPNLRCQLEGSFIPRSNIEEAILLLMILLKKYAHKKAEWDCSIIDHLTFALSVCGNLKALANQVEALVPGVMKRQETCYTLSLCYLGEGDDMVALDLLKKILGSREDPTCLRALLLASKICSENRTCAEEGVSFARRAVTRLHSGCDLISVANHLLGLSLSAEARFFASDSERTAKQMEALEVLEKSEKSMKRNDVNIIYSLSLENAMQRKLEAALHYAKLLLKLEGGSNVKGWILLAQILSAQKRFVDAETIISAALDQTGKWDQGDLLRILAKIQIAQGKLRNAVGTYTHLLAILQLKGKSSGLYAKSLKEGKSDKNLEMETWLDLSNLYTSMSQWNDAEVCLSKSKSINPSSSSRWYVTGKLYEAKGLLREALGAYQGALEIEATHVPSLVSTAVVLKQLGYQSFSVLRSFLTDALRIDKTSHDAWYHLGLLYKAEGDRSNAEAAECFQAAALLQESAPVEPFRR